MVPSGTAQVDIRVADGKIAVIGAPGSLGSPTRAVDATGRVVFPGALIHASTACHQFGFPVKEVHGSTGAGKSRCAVPWHHVAE